MYKNPDWETASKRLAAFWNKEIIDRPCLQIFTYEHTESLPETSETDNVPPEKFWSDPLIFIRKNLRDYKNTICYGRARAFTPRIKWRK